MSGQIFLSYRRDDSSAWAGRLSDRLSSHFPSNQIFTDVDTIEPGIDFLSGFGTRQSKVCVLQSGDFVMRLSRKNAKAIIRTPFRRCGKRWIGRKI
jgi:hypothetical protein